MPPALAALHRWLDSWTGIGAISGWNTILRLYGPLEAWFDRTWRPGEIEPVP